MDTKTHDLTIRFARRSETIPVALSFENGELNDSRLLAPCQVKGLWDGLVHELLNEMVLQEKTDGAFGHPEDWSEIFLRLESTQN